MACTSTAPQAPAPLKLDGRTFVGTALSGPRIEGDPAQLDWSTSWVVEGELRHVSAAPAGVRELAGRLVVREGAREVIGARSELADSVRRLPASFEPEAGEVLWSRQVLLALPAGATVAIDAASNPAHGAPPRAEWSRWSLEASRERGSAQGAQLALVLEGEVLERPAEDDEAPLAAERLALREVLVLREALTPGGQGLQLVLPARSEAWPRGAYLLRLRLHGEPGALLAAPAWSELVQRSRDELRATHGGATREAPSAAGEFQFEGRSALRSMRRQELQRPALIFLAETTGARLCEDLALVAGPEALAGFLTHTGRLGQESEEQLEGAGAFGWFLERSALAWLAARVEDENDPLEPELEGLWWRHTGELGHYPDLVREGLARCADSDELERLLVGENRLLLSDSSPAARVRAFDWLDVRGLAPAGFDPLGTREARRAALTRAEARREADATGEGLEGQQTGEVQR